MSADGKLRIQQIRSGIATNPKHRATLKALGLGRIGRIVEKPDNVAVRGMVAAIPHLVVILADEVGDSRTKRRRG
ncbi:MAG: 50S ribosomal protein L30 [Acidobacteria bacterium]|nr:50S ribosomal protein L30 [Acidobacteriota bacterium]